MPISKRITSSPEGEYITFEVKQAAISFSPNGKVFFGKLSEDGAITKLFPLNGDTACKVLYAILNELAEERR